MAKKCRPSSPRHPGFCRSKVHSQRLSCAIAQWHGEPALSRCSINSRAVMELLKHPLVTLGLELALIFSLLLLLRAGRGLTRSVFPERFVVQRWDGGVGMKSSTSSGALPGPAKQCSPASALCPVPVGDCGGFLALSSLPCLMLTGSSVHPCNSNICFP